MKFGVFAFLTESTLRPSELAREAEQRGFDSMWVPDHTHVPSARQTPYPAGGDLPPEYSRMLEPFCALTEAAAVTSTLLLGTGVCLVAQRDPIILAKQTATVDLLSRGRFMLGVGYGWSVEEMRNHGLPYKKRHVIAREKLLALKSLWTQTEGGHVGEYVDIEPSWLWPKPVQRPHPPILFGAKGPIGYRQLAELGDGWMPTAGGVAERRDAVQRTLEARGRTLDDLDFTVFAPRPTTAAVEHYEQLGVGRLVLALPTVESAEAMHVLDTYTELATRFR